MKAEEIVLKYFEAWNKHDADALEKLVSDHGCYRDPIVPGGLNGAGLKAYALDLWKAFPDLEFDYSSTLYGVQGRMACEWVFVGTHTGWLQNYPPSNRGVSFHGVDIFEISDSKLDLVWGHYDSGNFFKQLEIQSKAA